MPPSSLPKFLLISLLSSIITATIFTHSYSQCLPDQKTLLLELNDELIFDPSISKKLVQWNQTDECCNWYGVDCDGAGHVISLQLDDEGISDGIENSSTLFRLEYLEKLNLAYNEFKNAEIPRGIHNLTHLTHLNLSRTDFGGQLPVELSFLRKLVSLDLSHFNRIIDRPNFISLNLGFNSFTGNIPRSLFGLPSLRRLWLNRNQFIGQVEEFPIVNASNIVYLELSSNQLEGPIPNSLLQLQSLAYLSLSHNSFSGTLQLEKIHLPNLVTLDLSFNNLSVRGNVNSSSSRFPKLNNLNLASCDLYEFPEFINNSMIAQLDLSNNRIAGEIPSWIWGISNEALYTLNLSSNLLTGMQKPYHIPRTLAILDLHSNQLRGELHLPFSMQDPIPVLLPSPNTGTFFTSSTIYFLSLANNSLTGSIPTSLCNATNLGLLDLSLNQLSGNIPPCLLANKENLEVFNLGGNNLSGHIPDNIPLSCRLQNFDLNNNNLEGNFPKSIQNCYWLDFMNVGNNIINDSFPCMLPSFLRVIVLTSNRFHGELRCHKSWPNLQIVDISSNNFSGSLEAVNFSSWGAMMLESDAYIRTVSNFLKPTSRIYYPIGVTVTLNGLKLNLVKIWRDNTVVDFSSNNFLGVIPSAIGDLRYLRYLNLSHNAINGSIPKSFGKLGVLGSLDLSVNQLTGTIPLELAGLTTLSTLNLSYNKLVGNIPKGSQFQTFTVDSFKGNPGLCLNVSCSTNDGNGSSPPQHEKVESKKEIEWEYVWAAVGFVVGLGSIAWILLCCRSFRERYFDKLEDVVEKRLYGMSRRRRRARRLVRTQGRR